jgi:hypothetical protein
VQSARDARFSFEPPLIFAFDRSSAKLSALA